MSFTYESEDRNTPLETFEWDNVWWDNSKGETTRRFCVVGDSISCGYRRVIVAASGDRVAVDGFGTSKAVDNPLFPESLRLFFRQSPKTDALLFNNGLHGFHLDDRDAYGAHYGRMVDFLRSCHGNLYLVLTTPVRERDDLSVFAERNQRVLARNETVLRIAAERNLPVIDLYHPLENRPELYSPDGVHLNADGYRLLADTILQNLV